MSNINLSINKDTSINQNDHLEKDQLTLLIQVLTHQIKELDKGTEGYVQSAKHYGHTKETIDLHPEEHIDYSRTQRHKEKLQDILNQLTK